MHFTRGWFERVFCYRRRLSAFHWKKKKQQIDSFSNKQRKQDVFSANSPFLADLYFG